MPRLRFRQERFCHRFIECGNSALAARSAGYAPATARNTGYRLLQIPEVVLRIAELQSALAGAGCRKTDVLLGKLETVYRRAIDDRQFSAAARSVELQARLGGMAEKAERRPAARASTRKETDVPAAIDSQPDIAADPLGLDSAN